MCKRVDNFHVSMVWKTWQLGVGLTTEERCASPCVSALSFSAYFPPTLRAKNIEEHRHLTSLTLFFSKLWNCAIHDLFVECVNVMLLRLTPLPLIFYWLTLNAPSEGSLCICNLWSLWSAGGIVLYCLYLLTHAPLGIKEGIEWITASVWLVKLSHLYLQMCSV